MNTFDRASFTKKRKTWALKRDNNTCQAPFDHQCDTKHPLQIHHILPHAYMNKVASDISADYPENFITLCRTAHEVIHPDVAFARTHYDMDSNIFQRIRKQRTELMDNGRIYWNDVYDRPMMVVALINTRKFKKQFPSYKPRTKHEIITDSEGEDL